MFISINLLLSVLILVTLVGGGLFFLKIRKRKYKQSHSSLVEKKIENESLIDSHDNFVMQESNTGFSIVDDSDRSVVFSAAEVAKIPNNAKKVELDGNILDKVTHITADLVTKGMMIPNKTIQVTFLPEIQKGLDSGVYTLLKTKSGEVLADAVHTGVNGKINEIVGKGRLVETGKFKRVAIGAFQVASIVVAQSHLADIQQSLIQLNTGIAKIKDFLDQKLLSEIRGDVKYLENIVRYIETETIKSHEFSNEKMFQIEGIIRNTYAWNDFLKAVMETKLEEIKNIRNPDWVGTAGLLEQFKMILDLDHIIEQYNTLLKLNSIIAYVKASIDPFNERLSNTYEEDFFKIFNEFCMAAMNKSDEMFKAIFNEKKTLEARNSQVKYLTKEAMEKAKSCLENFNSSIHALNSTMGPDNDFKLMLKFDSLGKVEKVFTCS